MCPIAHVPHPQGASPLCAILTTPLPMCPIAHVPHCSCVKMMSSCQKDVKLSKRCQMSKNQTHRLWRRFTKKLNWHNEVHTHWHQFLTSHMMVTKNPQNVHRKCFWGFLVTIICDVKNWRQCVWTSLCQFIFLWTSSIVYVFDCLTFDIFLTIWHLFDNLTSFWQFFNLNHLIPSQGYFW